VGAPAIEMDGVLNAAPLYECKFNDAWYFVSVGLRNKEKSWTIQALRGSRLPDSLENGNIFALLGEGLHAHMILLLVANQVLKRAARLAIDALRAKVSMNVERCSERGFDFFGAGAENARHL
jgi:hypothetical protein